MRPFIRLILIFSVKFVLLIVAEEIKHFIKLNTL
jgi:hypothetical protein